MTVATLIPGLDEIVRHGDPKRRADAARQIAELFLLRAANLRSAHVDLFDGILTGLIPYAEIAERAELAERLSLLDNAPRALVGQLAGEEEISVAGPLLRRCVVIDDGALIEIARAKGQGHLLAISERPTLSSDLTDVIVRRGDREVVRRAAGNAGASFSSAGYSTLIKRARRDGVLTIMVGRRDDLSAFQLKELLEGSTLSAAACSRWSSPAGNSRSSRRCARSAAQARLSTAAAISRRRNALFWLCIVAVNSTKPRCWALRKATNTRKLLPCCAQCRV